MKKNIPYSYNVLRDKFLALSRLASDLSSYDSDGDGIVDNAEQLNSQLPSYYLDWDNFINVPTTLDGYGITDAFDGDFSSLVNLPNTLAGYHIIDAFNGDFYNLTNRPTTIHGYGITDAFDWYWDSLLGKPDFATVAFTGSYNDLNDVPIAEEGGGSGSMIYPGVGVACSTGSSWGSSYSTTGSSNILVCNEDAVLSGILTVGSSVVVPNGGTIGQVAGPLLTFDDTNNYLEITGAAVVVGGTATVNSRALSVLDAGGFSGIYTDGSFQFAQLGRIFMGSTNDTGARLCLYQNADDSYIDYYTDLHFRSGSASSTDRVIFKTGGSAGFGTVSPNAKIESLATTEQLRLSYDTTHYTSFTVGATGGLSITSDYSISLIPEDGQDVNVTLHTGNALRPTSNVAGSLGDSGHQWEDLFLGIGGVINFHGGDITLTHSTNTLTVAGGSLALGANTLKITGDIAETGFRSAKGWFTDIESTNYPTVSGVAIDDTFLQINVPGDENDVVVFDSGALLKGSGVSISELAAIDNPTFTTKITTPAIKMTTSAAAGKMIYSDADGDFVYLTAGTTSQILVGGGAAAPVWTTATGTGAPVRANAPTLDGAVLIETGIYPEITDGAVLGSTSKMWSDLFLASGSVINWSNSDITLTHALNTLTLAGATTLAIGSTNITMSGDIAATGTRVTKGWFTDLEITNAPTVNGTAISSLYINKVTGALNGYLPVFNGTSGVLLGVSPYQPTDFASSTHNHDSSYISIISSPSSGDFPLMSAGGELTTSAYGPSDFESALGNPGTTGYLLTSTSAGVRSWVSRGDIYTSFQTLSYSASKTWDIDNGYNAKITLTGDCALTITNADNGCSGCLIVIQDASGGHTLSFAAPTYNLVIDGGLLTLDESANNISVLTFVSDGTNLYWSYGNNYLAPT